MSEKEKELSPNEMKHIKGGKVAAFDKLGPEKGPAGEELEKPVAAEELFKR